MSFYIRQKETKKFLTRDGAWTQQREDALEFDNAVDAISYITVGRLIDVELFTPEWKSLEDSGQGKTE